MGPYMRNRTKKRRTRQAFIYCFPAFLILVVFCTLPSVVTSLPQRGFIVCFHVRDALRFIQCFFVVCRDLIGGVLVVTITRVNYFCD